MPQAAKRIPPELPRMLSMDDIERITGLSRWTIRRLRKLGKFPEPHPMGDRKIVWPEDQFRAWNETLGQDGKPPGTH